MERLSASVAFDGQQNKPMFFGYNGDASEIDSTPLAQDYLLRHFHTSNVNYTGSA
jgi:hypothetical protein